MVVLERDENAGGLLPVRSLFEDSSPCLLAAQILGASDPALRERVRAYKAELEATVLEKARAIKRTG